MKRVWTLACCLILTATTLSCGQKGPLVLPQVNDLSEATKPLSNKEPPFEEDTTQ